MEGMCSFLNFCYFQKELSDCHSCCFPHLHLRPGGLGYVIWREAPEEEGVLPLDSSSQTWTMQQNRGGLAKT